MYTKLILVFALACSFSTLAAQTLRTPTGVVRVTTASGVGCVPKPDKTADWMKYVITIPKDETHFSMLIKEYKEGVYVSEPMDEDWILLGAYLNKNDKVIFELVPDISNPVKLSLFVYTGGASWLKTRYATKGSNLKYIRYEESDTAGAEGILPLLLIYEDTSSGKVEKEITKLSVNGRLPVKYVMKTSLFEKLPHCMIVYCQLKTK